MSPNPGKTNKHGNLTSSEGKNTNYQAIVHKTNQQLKGHWSKGINPQHHGHPFNTGFRGPGGGGRRTGGKA